MTDIKEIAGYIYSKDNTKSHGDLVRNFEKYSHEIDAINHNNSPEIYDTYSQLIADYGIALAQTKNYKKAIPVIDKALDLLRNNKKFTQETLSSLKFYEVLLFNRGRSYYYLNNFELAKTDFNLLTKLYPDNTIYPKWIFAIKNKNLIKLKNVLWYFITAIILVDVLLNKTISLRVIIVDVSGFALLIVLLIEAILYFKKKNQCIIFHQTNF